MKARIINPWMKGIRWENPTLSVFLGYMEGKKGLDMVLLRAYVPMTESGNAGQKEGKGNMKMVFNS